MQQAENYCDLQIVARVGFCTAYLRALYELRHTVVILGVWPRQQSLFHRGKTQSSMKFRPPKKERDLAIMHLQHSRASDLDY
jgi:hypothetical protein